MFLFIKQKGISSLEKKTNKGKTVFSSETYTVTALLSKKGKKTPLQLVKEVSNREKKLKGG